jgi:hypothetical protein
LGWLARHGDGSSPHRASVFFSEAISEYIKPNAQSAGADLVVIFG